MQPLPDDQAVLGDHDADCHSETITPSDPLWKAGQMVRKPGRERGKSQLTWLGHATVLLDLGRTRLLTDPVLGRRIALLRRVAPSPSPRATDGTDVVLLSHLHADHLDLPSLCRIERTARILAPRAVVDWLEARGFDRLRALRPGDTVELDDVRVEATPARHAGRRWPHGPAAGAIGFRMDGPTRVYFAGDADLFPQMASLRDRVAVALVPMWGWGLRLGHGHLDPRRAAEALAMIQPSVAIPIHWGTLARPSARP